MPTIKIPEHLLPVDGRFGCGPSKIREAQLDALVKNAHLLGTSHRQAPIKELVKQIQSGLLELFHNPPGYEIILGNGGSTAFWDAAAYSLAKGKSQALVHGEFGAKFANALKAPFLESPTVITSEVGSRGELLAEAGVKQYVYPQNETSTGVITPVARVVADSDALFLTDATSSAGGVDFDPQETDVYYFAPQKNFGSDGGLWLALVSPKAIARIEEIAATDRYIPEFLSLKVALDNSRQNQTLNTPALATLVLLNEQIKWINSNGGLAWADAKTKAASAFVYAWAERASFASCFVTDPAHRSQVVCTIDFAETVHAMEVSKVLRENGILDVDPYRKLGRNQLRIATFTAIDITDVERLTAAIDFVVERI